MQKTKSTKKVDRNEEARRELFKTNSDPSTVRKRRSEEQAAQNVTMSLVELREMMASDLKRNEETMHTLINSSTKLGDTKQEMDTISSNVKVGSRLITKFGRRECTDKVLIFAALFFFFFVVLWILKKRLLGWIW